MDNEKELRILWNEVPKFKSHFTEDEFVIWGNKPGAICDMFGHDYCDEEQTPLQYIMKDGVCALELYFD